MKDKGGRRHTKNMGRDFLTQPVAPMKGTWVQSLVTDIRFYMPLGNEAGEQQTTMPQIEGLKPGATK